jgi:predicted AAA+ superfamily ATPase
MDDRFLQWGGLPEIVLAQDDARRQLLLAEMWAAYLDREIAPRARGETVSRFRSFAELLAGQVGQLVNLNELANTLDVSRGWVSRYLDFLERTYLVRVLRPFSGNRRSEITKTPKVFFSDLGLRNLLAGSLGEAVVPDQAHRMENAVEILLRRAGGRLHFWRTVHGAEVDFVWQCRRDLIPIEVKCKRFTRPAVSRGYRSFLKQYQPSHGLIVNQGLDAQIEIGGASVRFVKLQDLPPLLSELRSLTVEG